MHVQVDVCDQEPFVDPDTCHPFEKERWSFNQESGNCERWF